MKGSGPLGVLELLDLLFVPALHIEEGQIRQTRQSGYRFKRFGSEDSHMKHVRESD